MDSALGTGQLGWRSQDCVPCRTVQGTVRITQHLGSQLSSWEDALWRSWKRNWGGQLLLWLQCGMEVSAETAEVSTSVYKVWFPDQISSARGPRGDAHSYVHPVLLSQHYDFSRWPVYRLQYEKNKLGLSLMTVASQVGMTWGVMKCVFWTSHL